jgi:hypothetical protein
MDRIRIEDDKVAIFAIYLDHDIDDAHSKDYVIIAVTPRCTRDKLFEDPSVRITGIYVQIQSQRFMKGLWTNTTWANLERKTD